VTSFDDELLFDPEMPALGVPRMPAIPTATVKLMPPPTLDDSLCVASVFAALSRMTSRAAVRVVVPDDVMAEPRTLISLPVAVTLTVPPATLDLATACS
jgi:hypothetical protein